MLTKARHILNVVSAVRKSILSHSVFLKFYIIITYKETMDQGFGRRTERPLMTLIRPLLKRRRMRYAHLLTTKELMKQGPWQSG